MFYNTTKPALLTFTLGILFIVSQAQKQTFNWYFGDKVGINFASAPPTVLTDGAMNTTEGVASISDKNGNLLFYTDGRGIWNRLHVNMPTAPILSGHPSSTQSAIIVPQPGNDSIYYVFTTDAFGGPNGLNYVIVNMNKNNGLGDVITLPVQLLTPTCEKITAIKHCNNKDIWVISRDVANRSYYAWLVTAAGLTNTPVISLTPNLVSSELGYLKGSPNGKQLAAVHFQDYTELSDFNNLTGLVSNTIKIAHPLPIPGTNRTTRYGLEFSPDNKYMYISTTYYLGPVTTDIYIDQYNIIIHDSATIEQSRFIVTKNASILSALQLGYDHKIYIAENGKRTLSRINDPNVPGSGCNFQLDAVDLQNRLCHSGLPSFIQSLFNPAYDGYNFSADVNCNAALKKFTINDISYIDSVKWNFDDPMSGANDSSVSLSPVHLFTGNGTYHVRLRVFKRTPCLTGIDTIENTIDINQVVFNLGPDKEICDSNTVTLDATTPGASAYLWNTGAVTPTLIISQPGDYWCRISINACEIYDTVTITKKYLPDFSLGVDTAVCIGRPFTLRPLTDPSWHLLWQDGGTQNTYTVNTPGRYSLTASNSCGLTKKEINITAGICEVYIPGAFTPDGNSKNDKFNVLGTELLTAFDLEIFDRYGRLIFKTKDKNTGWDGKIAGKPAINGTYIYVLKYITAAIKQPVQLSGSFVLIR